MAKKNKNTKPKTHTPRIVNRRARHDYHIIESLEVGIALLGSEVKSIRNGQVSLAEGFAMIDPSAMELFLHDVDIAQYKHATSAGSGHAPKRRRKLLAHRKQIRKLQDMTNDKGNTLIPLTMYFERGMVKLEIAVAKGKRDYDKRQDMKTRDAGKEIRRAMTKKIL